MVKIKAIITIGLLSLAFGALAAPDDKGGDNMGQGMDKGQAGAAMQQKAEEGMAKGNATMPMNQSATMPMNQSESMPMNQSASMPMNQSEDNGQSAEQKSAEMQEQNKEKKETKEETKAKKPWWKFWGD